MAVHFITRKSELERVLSTGAFSPTMQKAFSASLLHSRQLYSLKTVVFGDADFDITRMTTAIVEGKKMSTKSTGFRTKYGDAVFAHMP